MKVFIKILKVVGIIAGIMTILTILGSLSTSYSLFYWMCACMVILPILFWQGWRFGISVIFATCIAVTLALSPVDFVFQRGKMGIHIVQTSYGITITTGTIGYGCSVSNPPYRACVISF
jgi:hypothetical protein